MRNGRIIDPEPVQQRLGSYTPPAVGSSQYSSGRRARTSSKLNRISAIHGTSNYDCYCCAPCLTVQPVCSIHTCGNMMSHSSQPQPDCYTGFQLVAAFFLPRKLADRQYFHSTPRILVSMIDRSSTDKQGRYCRKN